MKNFKSQLLILLVFIICIMHSSDIKAQRIQCGVGVQVGFLYKDVQRMENNYISKDAYYSILFGPSYKVKYLINENFALSIYPTISLDPFYLAIYGLWNIKSESLNFGSQMPIAVEYWFGDHHGTTLFGGIGVNYASLPHPDFIEDIRSYTFAIELSLGGQLDLKDHYLTVRLSCALSLNKNDVKGRENISNTTAILSIGTYHTFYNN